MLKKLFQTVDMTTGEPWQKILIFTLPMLLGNIAQQLYNTVDSIVVGRYVGDNALAAVGSAGPIINLLLVLFIGVSMGASIMCAQFFGARDREGLSYAVGNCILLIFLASVLMTVSGLLLSRPLLEVLGTPDEIIDWCESYLRIMFLGSIGMGFYNILSGVLRGIGDAVPALVYLLVSTVLNIFLDILFVTQFHMGVDGVAWATIIAQGISALLCLNRLRQMSDLFDFGLRFLKWQKRYANRILLLGLPSGVTQGIISMSMILVQSLTNTFGPTLIAANVIVQRVDGFAMLPNFSFGTAMTTYAGQNVGAGKMDRVQKGAKQGTLLAAGITTFLTALILIFGKQLMGIFTETEDLVALAMRMMRILAAGYIVMAVLQSLSGIMRGAGDTTTPMWISIIQTFFLRVPLAYLMVNMTKSPEYPQGRPEMLFASMLIAWTIGTLITIFFYRKGNWKKKALV
ncbi:MAG: MATE family efflux transporter [Lachnospiraceae bacterium]|nr:MATE family efflux transporter [Lachnospiraceae bacterium]